MRFKTKLISFEITPGKNSDSAKELKELVDLHKSGQPVSLEDWQKAGLPVGKRLLDKYGVEECLPLVKKETKSIPEKVTGKFDSVKGLRAYLEHYQLDNIKLNKEIKDTLKTNAVRLFDNDITGEEIDEIILFAGKSREEKIKLGKRQTQVVTGRNNVEIKLKSSGRRILCTWARRGSTVEENMYIYINGGPAGFYGRKSNL